MNKLRFSVVAVAIALLSQHNAVLAKEHATESEHRETETPIKHLIVIVGENHTFDNLYATYKAPNGHKVANLLSKGIINEDGTPGPNFHLAEQKQAENHGDYSISPMQTGPYAALPQPNTTYASYPAGTQTFPYFNKPDPRFSSSLPNGPFQLTSASVPYDSYFGDPVHRFFQMWQMTDKGKNDLFPWVATTAGIGSQNYFLGGPVPGDTFQGGEALGFFNMGTGDAPVLHELSEEFAISDNYHQFIMGGTGANFIALVTGDMAFYRNLKNGVPTVAMPPDSQIENPNASSSYNNYYDQDGYSGGS